MLSRIQVTFAVVLVASLYGCGQDGLNDRTGSQLSDGKTDISHDQFCGGFAGFVCSDGYECVDDPSDDCDPEQGGADCIGICQISDDEEDDGQSVGNTPLTNAAVSVTTDQTHYSLGQAHAVVTVTNQSGDTVYLEGCNQISIERFENGQWLAYGGTKVCFWEGIAIEVKSGEAFSETVTLTDAGTWRLSVYFGRECQADLPLSQAGCTSFDTAYSTEIIVTP